MPTTVVTNIPLGSIDLKAFCACGDPCQSCCGTSDCNFCPTMPLTLFATFSNSGSCPYFDGVTFTLTFNPATLAWEGSTFSCPSEFPPPGTQNYQVVLQCNPGDQALTALPFQTGQAPPPPDSCIPFQMTFVGFTFGNLPCTNCPFPSFTVVITQ